MNQQSFGQKTGPDTEAGSSATGAGPVSGASPKAATGVKGGANAHQAVLGPFTIRDLAVFAATIILFVASLLPMFGGRYNLWNLNNLFFLGLGIVLPLAVSALFAARRLAPGTKIRIGSLSIDQFASVVASFAVAFFFLSVAGAYVPSLLVALIGAVVLFAVTVLGRFLPYISPDFQGRAEAPAHVVAREAAVPVQKPRAPKPPKAEAGKPDSGKSVPASASEATPGGRLSSGTGAGSSAVQAGTSHHAPATAAVPTASTVPGARATGAAPVSTAPEVSEFTSAGDPGPATQAADVVRPSAAPAAEETQLGDVPTAGAAAASADGSAAAANQSASHHDGGATAAPAAQGTWEPPAATAVHQQVRAEEPIGATVDPSSRPEESEEQPIHEAFWFAVAQHRTAFDPRTGAPAFVIEPGGWVLALEDRGHEFLVQHTDGRLGVLRDLSNIERG
ncbi:reticulon family protein [Arthrobacter sp. Z4-13]